MPSPTHPVRPLSWPAARLLASLGFAALIAGAAAGCHSGAGINDNQQNTNNNVADGGGIPDADLCGVGDDEKTVSAKPRVYNGTEEPSICISPRQQQAVGALIFEQYYWENGCTGTLVSDDVVVTAAHCVQEWGHELQPNQVRFVIGRNAVAPDKTFSVSEVHAHPDYQGDADHDIGILVLGAGVLGDDTVLPIPVNTVSLTQDLVGTWTQQGGYGSTEDNDENHLRWWTQLEEVTEVLSGEFVVFGQSESSVCYGDSGGPSLHLWNDDHLALLGTVSWGDESCMDYDHFARVDDNVDFIQDYTGTVDACFGIDEKGICDGDVALWCEGGELKQQCCGDENMGCIENNSGNFRCENQCGDLTWEGRCLEGDVVEWCENGEVKTRHCEPCAQVCGWSDDVLGNYCVDL